MPPSPPDIPACRARAKFPRQLQTVRPSHPSPAQLSLLTRGPLQVLSPVEVLPVHQQQVEKEASPRPPRPKTPPSNQQQQQRQQQPSSRSHTGNSESTLQQPSIEVNKKFPFLSHITPSLDNTSTLPPPEVFCNSTRDVKVTSTHTFASHIARRSGHSGLGCNFEPNLEDEKKLLTRSFLPVSASFSSSFRVTTE